MLPVLSQMTSHDLSEMCDCRRPLAIEAPFVDFEHGTFGWRSLAGKGRGYDALARFDLHFRDTDVHTT